MGWGSSTRRGGGQKLRARPRNFVFLGFRREESGMSREICRDVPDPWRCSKICAKKVRAHFSFPIKTQSQGWPKNNPSRDFPIMPSVTQLLHALPLVWRSIYTQNLESCFLCFRNSHFRNLSRIQEPLRLRRPSDSTQHCPANPYSLN